MVSKTLIFSLALTFLAVPGTSHAIPTRSSSSSSNDNGFVKVSEDGKGFTRNGKPYLIRGANYWQGMNLGADECNGGNRTRMELEIKQMADMGINNLRVMASAEGPDDQPYRMRPSLMTKPGVYKEEVFVGLDYLLDTMARYDMTAVSKCFTPCRQPIPCSLKMI